MKKNPIRLINAETTLNPEKELIANTNNGILVDDTYKSAISFFTLLNELFEKSTTEFNGTDHV